MGKDKKDDCYLETATRDSVDHGSDSGHNGCWGRYLQAGDCLDALWFPIQSLPLGTGTVTTRYT